MKEIFPFVKLKSFENGWRYSGKLKEFIQIKHYNHLKNIDDSKILEISEFLNGVLLKNAIFKNFAWVLYFAPIPFLEIYFFCERDKNSGDKFTIFFGKKSKIFPIEDIYGFALIYVSMLSLIGRDFSKIKTEVDKKKFIELILKNQLNFGSIDLKKVKSEIDNISFIKDFIIAKNKVEIEIMPFKNVFLKYVVYSNNVEFFVTSESLYIYPKSLIDSIALLFFKAFYREVKK